MSEIFHNVEMLDQNDLLPPGPFQNHTCTFGNNEPEFTDEQIHRLDEIESAAYEFLKILAESDDIPEDMEAIWSVIYSGESALMRCLQRRVKIPTRVTLKDGTTFIVDYDDEIDCEIEDINEREHL